MIWFDKDMSVFKRLKKSRLRSQLLTLHALEFLMIEQMARDWLKSVNLNYDSLEEHNVWVVLIGALVAMDKAEFYGAIKTKRSRDKVVEVFEGFLKQGIPIRDLWTIQCDMDEALCEDRMAKFAKALQDKCGFSEFEACVKCIAIYVSACVTDDGELLDKVSDALYQFYLRAADDYFVGYDDEQSK